MRGLVGDVTRSRTLLIFEDLTQSREAAKGTQQRIGIICSDDRRSLRGCDFIFSVRLRVPVAWFLISACSAISAVKRITYSSFTSLPSVPTYWSSPKVIAKPRATLKTIVHGRDGRTRKRKASLLRRPPASLPCFPFFPWSNLFFLSGLRIRQRLIYRSIFLRLCGCVSFSVLSGRGQTPARRGGRFHAVAQASDL